MGGMIRAVAIAVGCVTFLGGVASAQVAEPAPRSGPCLECHDTARRTHWAGSRHERLGVTCTSCHLPHQGGTGRAPLKAGNEADTCFTCHASIRSRTLRTSRHPVRDGLMACSSCHDAHGTANDAMLPQPTTTETCLRCHAELRGPFLWEHAPAREDCTLCHDAHGSSHRPLLVSRVPYLCQRCHLNVQHPSQLFDHSNSGGGGVARRAPEQACARCHRAVHGSNHPSGAYLER
jgi:DmsE family decaheme c-type cytochrome